jgi:hypothetical protein
MTTLSRAMRFLLPVSIAACLLMVSLRASDNRQTIELRFFPVSDVAEMITKKLGADSASAILAIDPRRNAITLREEHPAAPKVRDLIASLDHKPEQLMVAVTVTSKTAAKAGAPAIERVLARPTIIGNLTEGALRKPMIVTFEQNGETFRIEIQASILKP